MNRKVIVPENRKVVVPENRKVVVPMNRKVIVPENTEVIVPENRKVVVPENTEVIVPENRKVEVLMNRKVVVPENTEVIVPENRKVVVPDNRRVEVPMNRKVVVPENTEVIVPENRKVVVPDNRRVEVPMNRKVVVPENRKVEMPMNKKVVVPENTEVIVPENRKVVVPENRKVVVPESTKVEVPIITKVEVPMNTAINMKWTELYDNWNELIEYRNQMNETLNIITSNCNAVYGFIKKVNVILENKGCKKRKSNSGKRTTNVFETFYCGKSKITRVLSRKTQKLKQTVENEVFKKTKCDCCTRQDVSKEELAKKSTNLNDKKQKEHVTKKAEKRMKYNYRKNGKVIECRMSDRDRKIQEKMQKNVYCHTKRTFIKVIKKMDETGRTGNVINRKSESSKDHVMRYVKRGRKQRCHVSTTESCKIKNSKEQMQSMKDNVKEQYCVGNFVNMCWICDESYNERQMQCEKCEVFFHLSCSRLRNMKEVLMMERASWICCKCGHSNYCANLFNDFGISTDPNVFDLNYNGEEDHCCNDAFINLCRQDGDTQHVSELKFKEEEINTLKQNTLCRKRHTVMLEQSGGYYLRSKKTKAAQHVNGTSSKEKSKENTINQAMTQDHLKTCNTNKRSLLPCKEMNEKKVKKDVKSPGMNSLNVQGHFHQGHLKFGVNTGKQCVANSLCAMMYSHIKELRHWTSYDMDLVLNTGDELYGHLTKSSTMNNDFLLINELPNELIVFNKSYTMTYHESVTGMFEDDGNLSEFNMMQLNRALKQTLERYSACFICFNGNTFGVIAQDGVYYIFDSHSRDDNGWQVQDGRSLLKFTPTWQDVYRYCTELRTSMNLHNNEQFEITGVTLCQDDDATVCRCRSEEVDEQQNPQQISDLNMCDMTKEVLSELPDKEGNDIKDCKPSCECSGDLTDTCTGSKTHVDVDTSIDDICADSSGIEMTIVSEPGGFKFIPLSYEHKKSLCKSLGFGRVYSQSVVFEECERIGHPEHLRNIQGDGNCFFRAVSFAISGTERNHMRLRLATVNHLLKHASRYNTYLREGFSDVEGYIGRQRMFCSGVWATEVEIMAVAHMLETDIYTFANTCRWYIFSGKMAEIGSVTSDAGIYLNHSHGIHYDVVLSVHKLPLARSVIEEHSIDLAGCDVSNIINTQNESIGNADNNNEVGGDCNEQVDVDNCINKQMKPLKGKKRKRKVSAAMRRKLDRENKRKKRSEDKNNNEDFHDEDHEMVIKTNKKQYKNMKYQLNILHKQRQINAMKTKYHEDSVCRERKNSGLKTKYHEDSVCRERKKSGLKTKYHEDSMCRERKKSGL